MINTEKLNEEMVRTLAPPRRGTRWQMMQRRAALLVARGGRIFELLNVEAAEVANLVFALAWFLPCVLHNGYMASSRQLQSVQDYIAPGTMILITAFILIVQMVAVTLGGHPPVLMDNPSEEIHRKWYRIRAAVLALCGMWWWFMAVILTSQGIAVGTVLHSLAGISCAVGVWKLDLLLSTKRKECALKDIQCEAERMIEEGYTSQA